MVEKLIRSFHGHSGSVVELIKRDDGDLFIRKTMDVDRNYERLTYLGDKIVAIPKVFSYNKPAQVLEMEYVPHLSLKAYLQKNDDVDGLCAFIKDHINRSVRLSSSRYWGDIYEKELKWVDSDRVLPFKLVELLLLLPHDLPSSEFYHGDMTLENIIWGGSSRGFMFLDPVTVPWTSWVFDIAKMRQDTTCRWFLRHESQATNEEYIPFLEKLESALEEQFPAAFDDSLLLIMLLRVYKRCQPDTLEYDFILTEIYKTWLRMLYGGND